MRRNLIASLSLAALALSLGGCDPSASPGAQVGVTVAVSALCKWGTNQQAKANQAKTAAQLASDALGAVCGDPGATATAIIATYNSFAQQAGQPKAVPTTAANGAPAAALAPS